MSLSKSDVEHIAHLARLEVTEDELASYTEKLSRIIGFVDQLKQADTSRVEPMAHPLSMAQRLRPDEVTEPDQREGLQRNAAVLEDHLYKVPRVIE